MKQFLQIVQIIVAMLLIGSVIIQNKGVGLSGVFGGEGNVYRTKRGVERAVFYATIALGVALSAISIVLVIL